MKKFILSGIVLLGTAVLIYHFYAASEAEAEIHTAIQQQAMASDSLSVQYAEIDVAPFTGDITFTELSVIVNDHIQQVQELTFDIAYLDFLHIYFGGLRYGLEKLDRLTVHLLQSSYLNRQNLREVKMDSLQIRYQGDALDAVLSMIREQSLSADHSITASAPHITLRFPGTPVSKITARNFRYSGSFSGEGSRSRKGETHLFTTDSLLWSPSESFQNTYRFFIRGFGYSSDAIPFESLRFSLEDVAPEDSLHLKAVLNSELASIMAEGFVDVNKSLPASGFENMQLVISDWSPAFEQVLRNAAALFSFSLPPASGKLTLHVQGTLGNPQIVGFDS